MARRCRAGDGKLATTLARTDGQRAARLLGLGYLIAAVLYATLYDVIGWRGMLWVGVLPALAVVWIRVYVKESEVWVENQHQQKAQKAEVKVPLVAIFRRGMLMNTVTCCWWLISFYIVYYSIVGLFATYLTQEWHLSPAAIGSSSRQTPA